jgi:hypothetical protein
MIPQEDNLNVFKHDWLYWRYPRNWGKNIVDFFRRIKWAWQRATRGYCDLDVWNFDVYHTNLIIAALSNLAENHMGYAVYLKDGTKIKDDEEWTQYLLKIEDHFKKAQEYDDYYEEPFNASLLEELSNAADIEYTLGLDMLDNAYRNLWD